MPTYVYRSLRDPEVTYEFRHSMNEPAYSEHPQTGEPLQRILSAPVIRQRGLKKSTRVDKRSPAATACGCASSTALSALGMARQTPRYQPTTARSHSHGHGHGHGHGKSCSGHHKH